MRCIHNYASVWGLFGKASWGDVRYYIFSRLSEGRERNQVPEVVLQGFEDLLLCSSESLPAFQVCPDRTRLSQIPLIRFRLIKQAVQTHVCYNHYNLISLVK